MIKEKAKGNLIVLCGQSGCGKGTIISKLKEKCPCLTEFNKLKNRT